MVDRADEVEMQALQAIVDGFNKQAVGIPAIVLRFLELEGTFTKEQVDESVALYKDVLATKLNGKNLTVCQVAAFHVLAELVLQVTESRQREAQQVKKPVEPNIAYG